VPSRTVVGPSTGTNRYGPCWNPHTPNVCPKSSLPFSIPASEAMSMSPPMPKNELIITRPISFPALSSFHCRKSLTTETMSSKLPKKLRIPCWIGRGVTSTYACTAGLMSLPSTTWWISYIDRFHGSNGSSFEPWLTVAQPERSATARTAAKRNRRSVIFRSRRRPCRT
jgi:hypothetical protein